MTSYLRRKEEQQDRTTERTQNLSNAATVLLYVLLFVSFFREILVLLGFSAVSTVFYYAMVLIIAVISGLVIVSMINTKLNIKNIVQFFGGVLISLFLLGANLLNDKFVFSEHGVQMIGIILLTLYLSCEWIIPITKGIINCYFGLNFVTALILAAGIFIGSNYKYSNLIYNYASTNQAAIILMLVAMHLFIQAIIYINRKNYTVSTLSLILFCLMIVACYLTKSRAGVLTILLFLFIYLMMKASKSTIKVISVVLCLAPVVFPLIWVLFYSLIGANSDLTIFGKPIFSGRENIWIEIIETVIEHPFRLNLTELIFGSSAGHSAHNAVWQFIWSYNIIFAGVYIIFLYSKTRDAYLGTRGRITVAIYASILVLFFHMCFENALISGAVNFTFKAFLMITLLRGVDDDEPFKSIGGGSGLQRSKYLK